ncbi:MAG: acetoacetyl-CoA reductase [Gammaproteobacteria bacterium]|jgi:acetoacetyl-CoA reductase|nr:acetoacetyl-CoA reductase [Gammaproteobacteria bacterium]
MKAQIALVTGGTGGIGTAICRHLHDKEIRVISGYSRGGDNSYALKWQDEQQKEGYQFDVIYGNVSNFDSCAAMIDEVITKYGKIDILVNNAGITQDATLKKMLPDQWSEVLRVNLDSVFNVTQQVIHGMIERGFGRIINISSINGQKGQFGQTNYSAAKAGMHGFTKALAQEVASKGVTVNTVSPGYVATDMVKKMSAAVLDKIITQIPAGRLAEPSEIGHVVAFLASEASGYITGANIAINGGQHMY